MSKLELVPLGTTEVTILYNNGRMIVSITDENGTREHTDIESFHMGLTEDDLINDMVYDFSPDWVNLYEGREYDDES